MNNLDNVKQLDLNLQYCLEIFNKQAFIQALLSTAVFQKIQFLFCLLSSVALWGGPMVDTKGNIFEICVWRSLENAFFLDFS